MLTSTRIAASSIAKVHADFTNFLARKIDQFVYGKEGLVSLDHKDQYVQKINERLGILSDAQAHTNRLLRAYETQDKDITKSQSHIIETYQVYSEDIAMPVVDHFADLEKNLVDRRLGNLSLVIELASINSASAKGDLKKRDYETFEDRCLKYFAAERYKLLQL